MEPEFGLVGESPAGSERNFSRYSMFTLGEPNKEEYGYLSMCRQFTCKKTVTSAENGKVLVTHLKEALAYITLFKQEVDDKAQKLYQRKAQIGQINVRHELWKEELKAANSKMTTALGNARLSYTYIDDIESPTETASALRDIIRIETCARPLMYMFDELIPVLASKDLHQPALEFYKEQKRDCKALKNKATDDEKINGIIDIFTKVQEKISEVTPQVSHKAEIDAKETVLLYAGLLKFVKFTANSFRTKKPGEIDDGIPSPSSSSESGGEAPAAVPEAIPEAITASALADPPKAAATSWLPYWWPSWPFGQSSTQGSTQYNIQAPAAPIENQLLQEAPQEPAIRLSLNERIDKLVASIKSVESKLTTLCPRPARTALEGKKRKSVMAYKDKFTEGSPKPEDDFRGGARIKRYYYREMKPQIQQLQHVAKALADLQSTVETRNLSLGEGITASAGFKTLSAERRYYKTILNGLEELIYEQDDALLNLPLSNRIHAGGYYVERLIAKARQVRINLTQFNGLSSEEFALYSAAINRQLNYLDLKGTATKKDKAYLLSEKAVKRLVSSLQTAAVLKKPLTIESSLERLQVDIYNAIEKILGKKGPRSVVLSAQEATVPARVIAKSPLDSFRNAEETDKSVLPALLFTYLIKGFVNKLYFLDEKVVDPEFDTVFITLLENPLYKTHFNDLLRYSDGFKTLFEAYMNENDSIPNNIPQITLMDKALELIQNHDALASHETLKTLCHYCQAHQIQCELTSQAPETVSAHHRMRLDWFTSTTKPLFDQIQQACNYPDYFKQLSSIGIRTNEKKLGPIIYKLIVTGLYSRDPYNVGKKHLESLKTILDRYAYNELPQEPAVRTLLWIWAFENLMAKEPEKIPHGKLLLGELFTKYLADPNTRAMWQKKYGAGLMELALKKANHLPDLRDQETRALWEYALNSYSEFLTLLESKRSPAARERGQKLLQDLGQDLDALKLPPSPPTDTPNTHIEVARWCHAFMSRKLDSL